MAIIEILGLVYLWCFSLYHVVTGFVSVMMPNFALKFYRTLYGFQPIETKQLQITLRPWGNLAFVIGVIGFIVISDLKRFGPICLAFSVLLAIRIFYRLAMRRQLYEDIKVTPFQNWRMIFLQALGVVLLTMLVLG